jgi:hypothetical protein
MSFASEAKELRRDTLSMLETHIVVSSLIFLSCSYSRASPRTSSCALSRLFYRPNHHSYGFGSQENSFVPRRFGYVPCSHRGDRTLRRHGFPARGSYTRFEPRHLDSPRFPHCDSCDVPPLSKDSQSSPGSLRSAITDVMTHNTSHTRKL